MRRLLGYLTVAGLLFGAVALFWHWNTRATLVRVPDELPSDFPERGFSHRSFEQLLLRFVRDGRVNYAAWHADAEHPLAWIVSRITAAARSGRPAPPYCSGIKAPR